MGGRGNCCTVPFAADNSYDRIMLRFRPIAPKPAPSAVTDGSYSARSSPDCSKGSRARCTKSGRRYVRSNTTTIGKRKKKKKKIVRLLSLTPEEEIKGTEATATSDKVTLPLLPPPCDHRGNHNSRVVCGDVTDTKDVNPVLMWSGAGNYDLARRPLTKVPPSIFVPPEPQLGYDARNGGWFRGGESKWGIGAYVVVEECVTDEGGDGVTDEGRVRSLWDDTCPCFISDGVGRVRWLNEAFRRMVAETGGDKGGVAGVWLVMREEAEAMAMALGWSFVCRVRIVCTWRGMKISSLTSPCDVWRLDGGDFAWRLDVGAALRLAL